MTEFQLYAKPWGNITKSPRWGKFQENSGKVRRGGSKGWYVLTESQRENKTDWDNWHCGITANEGHWA